MNQGFKRARKPQEKEQRRSLLLQTARSILSQDLDLNSLSLNELAKQARMSKSNVYRYFETREAALLALIWDEWSGWYETLLRTLAQRRSKKWDLDSLVRTLAHSLTKNKLLCALTAALPSVVEHNLSDETIRNFKKYSLNFFNELGKLLETHCSELSQQDYAELLYDTACLLAALYPHAHPSKAVSRVLKSPDLHFFRRDFARDMERFMKALAIDLVQR